MRKKKLCPKFEFNLELNDQNRLLPTVDKMKKSTISARFLRIVFDLYNRCLYKSRNLAESTCKTLKKYTQMTKNRMVIVGLDGIDQDSTFRVQYTHQYVIPYVSMGRTARSYADLSRSRCGLQRPVIIPPREPVPVQSSPVDWRLAARC